MGGDLGRAWVCGRVAGVHGEKNRDLSRKHLDRQFFRRRGFRRHAFRCFWWTSPDMWVLCKMWVYFRLGEKSFELFSLLIV